MGSCASRRYSSEQVEAHYKQTMGDSTFEGNYTIEAKIGSGGFGTIYKVKHISGEELVAKKIETGDLPSEVTIMSQLNHANIIRLIEFFSQPSRTILILEYLPDCMDLFDYIDIKRRIPEKNAKHIIRQLTSALCYLHEEKEYAHLDVKPENILILPKSGDIKIIDFGASQPISPYLLTTFKGTRQYASPEILFQKSYDPVAADVWAVGVTLFKMVMGHLPFKKSRDYMSPLVFRHTEVSNICLETIAIILNPNPQLRPASIRDVKQCYWLNF